MNKTRKWSFLKIFWFEFKKIKKLKNIIPIFLLVGLFIIISLSSLDNIKSSGIKIYSFITLLGTILLIWKFISDILSKNNIDQDRAFFLNNKANIVILGRALANLFIFFTPFLLYIIFGMSANIILGKRGSTFGLAGAPIFFMYILSMLLLYLLIWLGINYIKSLNSKSSLIMAIFLILIFSSYWVATWVIEGLSFKYLDLSKNINSSVWIYFVPFFNISYIPSLLDVIRYNPWWKTAPFIVETIIIILLFWKSIVSHMKTGLCT